MERKKLNLNIYREEIIFLIGTKNEMRREFEKILSSKNITIYSRLREEEEQKKFLKELSSAAGMAVRGLLNNKTGFRVKVGFVVVDPNHHNKLSKMAYENKIKFEILHESRHISDRIIQEHELSIVDWENNANLSASIGLEFLSLWEKYKKKNNKEGEKK